MPLVRISVFETATPERRKIIVDAVHDAMRATLGIPEDDRFVVLSSHPREELFIDPHFMNMQRTEDFVLVHVTLRRGRSVETKQSFYRETARLLAERAKIAPDNTMIVLAEMDLADVSFGRGEAQYVLNPPADASTTEASR